MVAECEGFSEDVQDAVSSAYGYTPQVENMWAGEDDSVWCSFDVLMGQDVAIGDERRIELRNTLQALLEERFNSGVEVTLIYAADQDFLLLDTRESVVRTECMTISERVEKVIAGRYGDAVYISQVLVPEVDIRYECSFDVVTMKDLTADDPARVESSQAVQAILPNDVEANLIYADGRDTVHDSGVTTVPAPSVP